MAENFFTRISNEAKNYFKSFFPPAPDSAQDQNSLAYLARASSAPELNIVLADPDYSLSTTKNAPIKREQGVKATIKPLPKSTSQDKISKAQIAQTRQAIQKIHDSAKKEAISRVPRKKTNSSRDIN